MNIYKWHEEEFGVEPFIIGVHWRNEGDLIDAIELSIESGRPYDEYENLSEKDKKLYDSGQLKF